MIGKALHKSRCLIHPCLVYLRKRIDLNVFESLTNDPIRKGLNINEASKKKSTDNTDDDSASTGITKNKGKLQLDATVADARIKFSTDLD